MLNNMFPVWLFRVHGVSWDRISLQGAERANYSCATDLDNHSNARTSLTNIRQNKYAQGMLWDFQQTLYGDMMDKPIRSAGSGKRLCDLYKHNEVALDKDIEASITKQVSHNVKVWLDSKSE